MIDTATPFPPAGEGDWLYLDGLWVFIPRDAPWQTIKDAIDVLNKVATQRAASEPF